MRRILATLCAVFVISACQSGAPTGQVGETNRRYLEIWNSRLDGYRQQYVSLDAEIRKEADQFANGIQQTAGMQWPDLVRPTLDLAARIRELHRIAGRGETLSRFIAHMQTYPTPGLTEVWFQNEAADWQQAAQRTDKTTQQFLSGFEQKVQVSADWMREIEELVTQQGIVEGTGQELDALYRQALAFYGDVGEARAQDQYAEQQRQRASAALFAMGAYMNQLNYQQQLLNTFNRPRTCSTLGNSITCF